MRTQTLRPSPTLLRTLLGAALAAAALPACDNPACIFGGGCLDDPDGGDGGDGTPTSDVVFPVDAEWVLPGPPEIVDVFPSAAAGPSSPIVLVFSESMNPQTVLDAFEFETDEGIAQPGGPETQLAGDGRVLFIFPAQPLTPGTDYVVRFATGSQPTDLTGVALTKPVNQIAGTFSTGAAPPAAPQVLTTFPAAAAVGQSELGEVLVVFDRPVDDETVDESSFVVTVDDQPLDPATAPQALEIASLGGFAETRVYRWRREDAAGNIVPLPIGARVGVRLSPPGAEIRDAAGEALAETSFQFDLAPYGVPLAGALASQPDDAIGIENLVGALPLQVLVELAQPALQGDRLGVVLFGTDPGGGVNAAAERAIEVPAGATEVLLLRADLALVQQPDPLQAIFADGQVAFAFRYERAGSATPVRLLDTRPLEAGIQDPILDTVRPEFVGFGAEGANVSMFRSDLFDLALSGRANEELAAVEVAVTLPGGAVLDNGPLAPTAGAIDTGLFVAAPIDGAGFAGLGHVDLQVDFKLYDRALNSTLDLNATYVRQGAVGLPPAKDDTVEVHVYDAATGQALSTVKVFAHAYSQSGGPFGQPGVTLLDQAATGADGRAVLPLDRDALNLVTVDAVGYDLFTFQGVVGSALDVPLRRTAVDVGGVSLGVISSSESVAMYESRAADSRLQPPAEPFVFGELCDTNPFTGETICPFLPWAVPLFRPGAITWFATETPANLVTFDPQLFLRAFAFSYPRPALTGVEDQDELTLQDVVVLAEDPDPDAAAVGVPPHVFDVSAVPGLTPGFTPTARVEGSAPGIGDPVVVGPGLTFDANTDDVWDVRAAYPGAADPFTSGEEGDLPGALVRQGALDGVLYLRMEIADALGSRAVYRARIAEDPPAAALAPIGVPVLSSPTLETGGPSFTIGFANPLPADAAGLLSATLTELPMPAGDLARSWRLWLPKPAGQAAGQVAIQVPDLAAAGGTGLGTDTIVLELEATTHPDFAPEEFHWSEVRLRAERTTASPLYPLVQSP